MVVTLKLGGHDVVCLYVSILLLVIAFTLQKIVWQNVSQLFFFPQSLFPAIIQIQLKNPKGFLWRDAGRC